MELEEQQRKNIVLGLRIIGTFLFLSQILLLNWLPIYLKIPKLTLITMCFSLPCLVLGLGAIWGLLE